MGYKFAYFVLLDGWVALNLPFEDNCFLVVQTVHSYPPGLSRSTSKNNFLACFTHRIWSSTNVGTEIITVSVFNYQYAWILVFRMKLLVLSAGHRFAVFRPSHLRARVGVNFTLQLRNLSYSCMNDVMLCFYYWFDYKNIKYELIHTYFWLN